MNSTRDEKLLGQFGKRLKQLRTEQKLSQEQLAAEADLQLSQIGRIERGEINTTISTVKVLSTALGVPISELFKF